MKLFVLDVVASLLENPYLTIQHLRNKLHWPSIARDFTNSALNSLDEARAQWERDFPANSSGLEKSFLQIDYGKLLYFYSFDSVIP